MEGIWALRGSHLRRRILESLDDDFLRAQSEAVFGRHSTAEPLKGRARVGDVSHNTKLSADAGFHANANVARPEAQGIDAYIAENRFRQRDPRFNRETFNVAARYKPDKPKPKRYTPKDFSYDREHLACRCPAGTSPYLKNHNFQVQGRKAIGFMGTERDCGPWPLRARCLRDPEQKSQAESISSPARKARHCKAPQPPARVPPL